MALYSEHGTITCNPTRYHIHWFHAVAFKNIYLNGIRACRNTSLHLERGANYEQNETEEKFRSFLLSFLLNTKCLHYQDDFILEAEK